MGKLQACVVGQSHAASIFKEDSESSSVEEWDGSHCWKVRQVEVLIAGTNLAWCQICELFIQELLLILLWKPSGENVTTLAPFPT